jgi:hypothetical protein
MSEQWRGHYARCLECENLCASGEPCRCCLTAEAKAAIERLTKALANSEADYFRLRDKAAQFRDEWQSLEGVVQRVREVCDGIEPDHSVFVGDVLDALNGGDDE